MLHDRLEEAAGFARAALAADDPGAAFTDFVWALMEIHARDRGLYECYDRCPDDQETQEVEALTQELVLRAQNAGAVRADIRPADVPKLIGGVIRSAPPEQWRLYIEVVLDGLRPPAKSRPARATPRASKSTPTA